MYARGAPAGQGFSYKGKTLLSGIDPAGRADRIAQALPVTDRTLYLCPSPLYGYGLECLLARLEENAPNSAVLCIEADPELFSLSQEHFGVTLKNNSKLRLTDRCEPVALCSMMRQVWGPRFFRRVQILRLSGGWQLFPQLYDSLAQALQREIAIDWGNAITLAKLGRRYIRNALRNLTLIPSCPPLSQLSFGSDPVLVLGAGPSLDTLLDALEAGFGEALRLPSDKSKAAGRPFRIVCVDTCLPALRERGIMPDLAVILESQHWNLGDFIGLSGWNVPAALDLSALPRSASVLAGGVSLFFTPWTPLAIFKRLEAVCLLPPSLPPLGSVGLSAAAIARQLSSGNIIVAGLDFSFTLDSYHARCTPGYMDRLRRMSRFSSLLNAEAAFGAGSFRAVSKTGQPVFSSPALRNYRDLFEREFSGTAGFWDISGSGLPLGLPSLSPDDAIAMLSADGRTAEAGTAPPAEKTAEKLQVFIREEQDRLILLRNILTGESAMDYTVLQTLIEECDYLWAHFPDYAASSRSPGRVELEAGDPAVISFLKRVRIEIDSFRLLWESALQSI